MLIMRLLSILFFAAVFTASSASWGDSTTGNLHWGDSIELEGYRLEVADFSKEDTPAPMVLLKLYNRDGLITQRTLSQGQNFSLDDEIMAAVDAISVPDHSEGNDQPEAKVRLVLKAIPEIILHLTSSKDSYEPGEEIRLGLTVENQGTVDAEGIRINISSVPELLARDYGISELKAGGVGVLADTDAENAIILWAPYSQGLKEFKIRARAEYSDESSKGHESDGYGAFSVTDQLRLHKQVQETMKLGTSYPVILTLRNPGENSGSADLSDGLPDGFSSSSSLKWKVEVEPGKTQTVSYDMKPEGQGGDFILPPAVARYDLGGEAFESRSESPSVNVTGPRLNVEKRISSSKVRPGEAVVVSIDVKNEGNQTVKASLNESLPAFAKLVGGKTRISQILKPGDIASLSYSISWNRPGDYVIPAASISYTNSAGDLFNMNSSSMELEVREEGQTINASNITSAAQQYVENGVLQHHEAGAGSNYLLPGNATYLWAVFAALLAFIYILLDKIL